MKAALRDNALTVMLLVVCAALTIALIRRGSGQRSIAAPPAAVPVGHDQAARSADSQADPLSRAIPLLDLPDNASCKQAIEVIARTAGCQIDVNWTGLAREDGNRIQMSGLSGQFHSITVKRAIEQAFASDSIYCTSYNGVIFVDHVDNLPRHTKTLVYNVRDIVEAAAQYWAAGAPVSDQDRAAAMDELMGAIMACVSADTWQQNGGNVGAMYELIGLLTITQTPENHRSIADLLEDLRRTSHIDPEKSVVASAAISGMPAMQPAAPAEAALSRMVPQLPTEPPRNLDEALRVIQSAIQRSMIVDWQALHVADVERDAPLKVDWPPRRMTVREALNSIVQSVSGRVDALVITRQGSSIIITTESQRPKYTIVASYNIRDLIDAEMARFRAQGGDLSQRKTPNEAAQQIRQALTDFIDPPSWRDNGGSVGSLNEVMGLLFVQQTPENQDAVRKMLETMRASNHQTPGEAQKGK